MRRLAYLAAIAAATAAAGCGIFDDEPAAPTVVTQTVVVNTGPQAPASPAPSATPSPGTGTGPIVEVRVVATGPDTCPPGITPSGQQRTAKVGCSLFITCTPKVRNPSGELVDASPAVHGPAPAAFGGAPQTPAFSFDVWDSNPFNADIRALSPGATTFACTVGGVTGSNIFIAAP